MPLLPILWVFMPINKNLGTKEAHRALIPFSPLIDETDFSAQSQVDFLIATLNVFRKTENDLEFLVGDNCSTNLRNAEFLNLPIIGRASHRFNLAVHKILESKAFLLKRVNELMKRLSSLRKSGSLRKTTALRPVTRNDTRRTSLFSMLSRYFELLEIINKSDPDLVCLLPTNGETLMLTILLELLSRFESNTKMQRDSLT